MVPNFYSDATISAIPIGKKIHLDKVLLDGGAIVSIIPKEVATRAGFKILKDPLLKLRGYDGVVRVIPSYYRF